KSAPEGRAGVSGEVTSTNGGATGPGEGGRLAGLHDPALTPHTRARGLDRGHVCGDATDDHDDRGNERHDHDLEVGRTVGSHEGMVHGGLPSPTFVAATSKKVQAPRGVFLLVALPILAAMTRRPDQVTRKGSKGFSRPAQSLENRAKSDLSGALRDGAHRLEPGPRMDFRLREHRGLGAEALDDAANERPDAGRGHQHRRLTLARRLLELR